MEPTIVVEAMVQKLFAFLDDVCVVCTPDRVAMSWQVWHRSSNVMHTWICTRPKCGTEEVKSLKALRQSPELLAL